MKTKVINEKWVAAIKSVNIRNMTYKPAKISWASIGDVSIDEARDFANRILAVCNKAEKGQFDD